MLLMSRGSTRCCLRGVESSDVNYLLREADSTASSHLWNASCTNHKSLPQKPDKNNVNAHNSAFNLLSNELKSNILLQSMQHDRKLDQVVKG
jgi:hypothetical protein